MLVGFCFAAYFLPDNVKKGRKKSSEAESFKYMKIKYPTHLKMAM
jgi:hypothetical protein